jgi:ribosomal protein S15P/S13E
MATEPLLAHNVYFALSDSSPAARQHLVDACQKHLTGHPGTVFFAVGPLAAELQRPVNDRDFDVGLHIIFRTKADHDLYQGSARHLQFVAENKAGWKRVRVFDSLVEQADAGSRLAGLTPTEQTLRQQYFQTMLEGTFPLQNGPDPEVQLEALIHAAEMLKEHLEHELAELRLEQAE